MSTTIQYSSSNVTQYYSQGEWNGKSVLVHELLYGEQGPCPGHELDPMTHYGEIVPGELFCPNCCGVARV